jgi:Glycosyl hydrolase family 26
MTGIVSFWRMLRLLSGITGLVLVSPFAPNRTQGHRLSWEAATQLPKAAIPDHRVGGGSATARDYLTGAYADPPDHSTPAATGYKWEYTINNSYQDNCAGCGVSGLKAMPGYPVIIDLHHVQSSYPDFRAAANGEYDGLYLRTVEQLLPYAKTIYAVRIDSEFNGSWSASSPFSRWSTVSPRVWKAGFRNLAASVRRLLPNAKIIWNPNIGQNDPFPYYPGDDLVDLIGPDLYCNPAYFSSSKVCWNNFLNGARGASLNTVAAFAGQRHKPIVIPEWADMFGDGYMISKMRDWMDSHNVVAQSYWDSGDALAKSAYLPALPENRKAYIAAFGNRPYTGRYWKPVIPVPSN